MSDETIGEWSEQLPADEWVEIPEFGVRVRRWADPPPAPAPDPQLSTSAQLRQTQRDLAASQADLSEALAARVRMGDRLTETIVRLSLSKAELNDANTELAQLRAELATARAMIHQLELSRDRLSSENIRLGVQVGTLAEALAAYAQPEPS